MRVQPVRLARERPTQQPGPTNARPLRPRPAVSPLSRFLPLTAMHERRLTVPWPHAHRLDTPYSADELTAVMRILVWTIVNEGGLDS